MPAIERRFAVGAEVVANRGVHFRVWAPDKSRVQVVIESSRSAMQWSLTEEEGGYWSGFVEHAKAGDRYRYKLDDSTMLYPDPASRFQPEGPHGPSQIVDATGFVWTDENWEGISHNRVIYEMHIGTFTAAGTYRAAIEELAELADLGVTVIEIMPLAEFDGKFGWGYDGVDIFAPYHHYGTPDDLRSFVNEAHRLGIAVILDVVYNHCGASGSYFQQFCRDYFSSKYKGDWGDVFNFDGDNSAAVREFICANAAYWVEEFHFDGFRLDATQQIFDESPRHILLDLLAAARRRANGRPLYVVAENEPQHSALVRSLEDGGFGLQGIVNDDFHHSAMVALKGHREAYFHDYLGRPQEFISAAKYGFLYQGQWYAWQKQNRGAPTYGVMQDAFIHFLQNHDQIANTGDGTRQDALAPPEMGLPVWHYEINGLVLEKRLFMPYQQNTVHVCYRVISATESVRLELRPALHYRALEAAVDENPVAETDYVLSVREDYFKLTGGNFPPLYLKTHGGEATFTIDRRRSEDIFYRLESFRGYAAVGQYWTPGAFAMTLGTTGELTFTCSTEKPETLRLVAPEEAYELEVKRRFQLLAIAETPVDSGMPAELVLAADQFIVTPAGRAEEAARARASGEEVKTIIAGYHWFTDWGRDTMISLEGLTLSTGRHHEARYILRTFANYLKAGLIPNMFPEHDKTGLYHTADATLWFFHALSRYYRATGDRETLKTILPKLISIVDHHLQGTLFNIGVDPEDDLLRQGQEGYQLTWMDAKVGDWVVTPRRGKAVELNALWYNALCTLAAWLDDEDPAHAERLREHAQRAQILQSPFLVRGGRLSVRRD